MMSEIMTTKGGCVDKWSSRYTDLVVLGATGWLNVEESSGGVVYTKLRIIHKPPFCCAYRLELFSVTCTKMTVGALKDVGLSPLSFVMIIIFFFHVKIFDF